VRIYAEDWGKPGDVGVVGELEGRAIGACWMRLPPPGIGLGSVDEHTPQLGIAPREAWPEKHVPPDGRNARLTRRLHHWRRLALLFSARDRTGC
jgi:hypothetical protein